MRKEVKAPDISCGHCVKTIEREVAALAGVRSVSANQQSRTVAVEWDEPPGSWELIRATLKESGYPPQE